MPAAWDGGSRRIGSGKAFGTLYAEAQLRCHESVAPYPRRLLKQVSAPYVQEITGLPPVGTPADVAKAEGSATAPYLARRLDQS